MCTCVPPWDNGLVNQKEGNMKTMTIIKHDKFGHVRTFAIRPYEIRPGVQDGDGVILAEIDPEFHRESFIGYYTSKAAALDYIETYV